MSKRIVSNAMKESPSSVGTINTLDQRLPKCAIIKCATLIQKDRRPVCRRAVEIFLQCIPCRLLYFLTKGMKVNQSHYRPGVAQRIPGS